MIFQTYFPLIIFPPHLDLIPPHLGTTFDFDIPFVYKLPNEATTLYYTGRKVEDDHAAIFEMTEEFLNG